MPLVPPMVRAAQQKQPQVRGPAAVRPQAAIEPTQLVTQMAHKVLYEVRENFFTKTDVSITFDSAMANSETMETYIEFIGNERFERFWKGELK